MSKTHIQGHGSTLEVYYTVINKSDIKSKDDFYRAYLENLIGFSGNSETYFSTFEYQNEDGDEISIKEKITDSLYQIVPDPTKDTIVLVMFLICKKGYLEFDMDDEKEIEISCSPFYGYQWIQNISQVGETIYTDFTDIGRPNEEGINCYFIDNKGEIDALTNGVWFNLFDDYGIDEETEQSIRETTDEWYEELFNK